MKPKLSNTPYLQRLPPRLFPGYQPATREGNGISEGSFASDAVFWEANNREGRVVMQSQGAKEGPLAFAQKRQPVWQAK